MRITNIFGKLKKIKKEVNKGRSVLVIWDSIYHADHFLESKQKFQNTQKIIAVDPASDRESIRNAGNLETVTIATSAAGRGVDIKLSQESLTVGGLHVIIPNKNSNRSLLTLSSSSSNSLFKRSLIF